MVIVEKEEQKFVLQNKWEVAVPLTIDIDKEGCRIHVWHRFRGVGKALLKKYKDNLLSDEAMAFVRGKIYPVMKRKGYLPQANFDGRGTYYTYIPALGSILHPAHTVMPLEVAMDAAYENLTTYDLPMTLEDGRIAFVAVAHQQIVAIACTDDTVEEADMTAEVGIETSLAHQGKGYATDCLIAISQYLHGRGITPYALALRDNPASHRTLAKAAYQGTGSFFNMVLERNTEESSDICK